MLQTYEYLKPSFIILLITPLLSAYCTKIIGMISNGAQIQGGLGYSSFLQVIENNLLRAELQLLWGIASWLRMLKQ